MGERYLLRKNASEDDMVKRLIEERGYHNEADVHRTALRELYKREFPPYNQSKRTPEVDPLAELSNAEYCVKVKDGEIEGDYCVFMDGQVEKRVPLRIIKDY
jgi:hypothetical protein